MKSQKKSIEVSVDNDEKALALNTLLSSIEYVPLPKNKKKRDKKK